MRAQIFNDFYSWSKGVDFGEHEYAREEAEWFALENASDIEDHEEALTCAKRWIREFLERVS